MALTMAPPAGIDTGLVERARRIFGAQSDVQAINQALKFVDDQRPITSASLVQKGGLLVIPRIGNHVLTSEAVEEALADED